MNRFGIACLCLALLSVQGCDRIRGIIASEQKSDAAAASGDEGGGATVSFSGPVADITESNFDAFVNQRDVLVVVNFGADWCGPCRQLGPVLERVSGEFGESVKLGKVNVDQARELAMKHKVRGIPDVRYFRNGKQVHKFSGSQPAEQIRESMQKHAPSSVPKSAKAETNGEQEKSGSLVQRILAAKDPEPEEKAEPEEAEPAIQPMRKDWLPPGVERK